MHPPVCFCPQTPPDRQLHGHSRSQVCKVPWDSSRCWAAAGTSRNGPRRSSPCQLAKVKKRPFRRVFMCGQDDPPSPGADSAPTCRNTSFPTSQHTIERVLAVKSPERRVLRRTTVSAAAARALTRLNIRPGRTRTAVHRPPPECAEAEWVRRRCDAHRGRRTSSDGSCPPTRAVHYYGHVL
ncbi:hypothetical protein V8D89_005263, partial [Ganoderma adspersum]